MIAKLCLLSKLIVENISACYLIYIHGPLNYQFVPAKIQNVKLKKVCGIL